jgi:endonuclease/exonuclease/phosphatase family metal-dependent hydrolase
MQRRADVAATIARHQPTVVALQELGPGRADGRHGKTTGTMRQTDSLVKSLAAIGASRYKLVRTTSYVKPGRKTGTQGARILYDSRKLALVSSCPERTGRSRYSSSCTIHLPILPGDSEQHRRRAAYAKFRVKATGRSFYVVSLHLDPRHSTTSTAAEVRYTQLRAQQVRTILRQISAVNTRKHPVVIAGDVNSWQRLRVGNLPHDELIKAGCYDTASAATRVNLQYSTLNRFEVTQRTSRQGFAPRLDVICIQGRKGADRFVNVTQETDAARPSDHNLIYADTRL